MSFVLQFLNSCILKKRLNHVTHYIVLLFEKLFYVLTFWTILQLKTRGQYS